MQRIIWSLGVVLAVSATQAGLAGASLSQPEYEVTLSYDVKVAMRDGVKLSTDIYRPKAPGKYGVVVIRTPYDNNSENNVRSAMYFAKRGFAVVVQDCRGREDSEGEWGFLTQMYAWSRAMAGPPCSDRGYGYSSSLS